MRLLNRAGSWGKHLEFFHLLALAYVLFSIHYAVARMLNTDCSYQLFTSINTKDFFFQEGRFGMFPTQIPLVLGVWLEVPMLLLVHLYSISFSLLYVLVLLVNQFVFNSREAALATILALVIGSGATFFHATTETHLLVVLGCLLYGAMASRERLGGRMVVYGVWGMILLWSLFVHPNALFITFFVCGLFFLQKRLSWREFAVMILACFVFLVLKSALAPADSYDTKQYARLADWRNNIHGFFGLWPIQFIEGRLWNQYLGVLVLFTLAALFYRKRLAVLFTFVSVIGFLVITILTFPDGDSDAMMEKSFAPAIFMVVLLFSQFYYRATLRWPLTLLVLLLSAYSFSFIVKNGEPYQKRLVGLRCILDTAGREHPKLFADNKDMKEDPYRYNSWATSLDALMLSRCMGEEAMTLFLTDKVQDLKTDTVDTHTFLYLPWLPHGMELQNTHYFNLPPVPYHRLQHGCD
ncbi:MAG: hypothetical protein KF843_04315 [Flavobacteriales bacterium]|nr:hypothetical protein [Flavobacteriales bacterium]